MQTVLVAGSSIFQAWSDVQSVAPHCTVRNRAVGGTTTAYWRQYFASVLAEESPDFVWLYCGSNDLNEGTPETEIVENVRACCQTIERLSPGTRVAYFGIIKAPQKAGKWERIDWINAQIRQGLPALALYVESNAVFFGQGGPVERFFVDDGLHLTPEAYEALAAYARPLLTDWMGPQ